MSNSADSQGKREVDEILIVETDDGAADEILIVSMDDDKYLKECRRFENRIEDKEEDLKDLYVLRNEYGEDVEDRINKKKKNMLDLKKKYKTFTDKHANKKAAAEKKIGKKSFEENRKARKKARRDEMRMNR